MTISTATGAAIPLVSVSTGGNPNGLAFDVNRRILYFTDNTLNGLYRDRSRSIVWILLALSGVDFPTWKGSGTNR